MNLQEKIAQTETEIYRTVQALDWIERNFDSDAVDLRELNVSLGQVSVSPQSAWSLTAWAGIGVIGAARHSEGNDGIYTFPVEGGNLGFVFVGCPVFRKWDERRGVAGSSGRKSWPERSLVDDLQAFNVSPVSQEATA